MEDKEEGVSPPAGLGVASPPPPTDVGSTPPPLLRAISLEPQRGGGQIHRWIRLMQHRWEGWRSCDVRCSRMKIFLALSPLPEHFPSGASCSRCQETNERDSAANADISIKDQDT